MRSLYDALVAKSTGQVRDYSEFLMDSGYTAFHSVPAPGKGKEVLTSPTLNVYAKKNMIEVQIGEVRASAKINEYFTGNGRGDLEHMWVGHHFENAEVQTFYTKGAAEHWVRIQG